MYRGFERRLKLHACLDAVGKCCLQDIRDVLLGSRSLGTPRRSLYKWSCPQEICGLVQFYELLAQAVFGFVSAILCCSGARKKWHSLRKLVEIAYHLTAGCACFSCCLGAVLNFAVEA